MLSGKKTDSVAIAVKKDVFEILGSENIYLCSIGDRVALVLHLHHKATGKSAGIELHIICNILIAST